MSLKRVPYQPSESIAKRLKIQPPVLDDIIKYIVSNPSNHVYLHHAFYQFKGVVSLSPFNVALAIPPDKGVEPIIAVINSIQFLNQTDFFHGMLECMLQDDIKNLIPLCLRQGNEKLVPKIVQLYRELDVYMLESVVFEFCRELEFSNADNSQKSRVVECLVQTLSHDLFNPSNFSIVRKSFEISRFMIILFEYGFFDKVLELIRHVYSNIMKSNNTLLNLNDWMPRLRRLLIPLGAISNDYEQFIDELVSICPWNNDSISFITLFENSSPTVLQMVMSKYKITQMTNGSVFFRFDPLKTLIAREYALLELAFGDVFSKDWEITKMIHAEIIDRIDDYLSSPIPKDLILTQLSYEFNVYHQLSQQALELYLLELVKTRTPGNRTDYRIVYKPTSYGQKGWFNLGDSKWKIVSLPASRFGHGFCAAFDTTSNKHIGYLCYSMHINQFNRYMFEQENTVMIRMEEKKTAVQLVPKVYDKIKLKINDEQFEWFLVTESFDFNVIGFVSHAIRKCTTYTEKETVLIMLKDELNDKSTQLVKSGFYYNDLTRYDIFVKEDIKTGDIEILFFNLYKMEEIEPPTADDEISHLVQKMTRRFLADLDSTWNRLLS